jgi:hypothetical protein
MDPVTLGCIAGGVIGGISAVGLLAQRRWMASSMRNRRHVAKVPHVALADLQERQLARVVGRAVKLEDVLEAPLSRPSSHGTGSTTATCATARRSSRSARRSPSSAAVCASPIPMQCPKAPTATHSGRVCA